MTSQLAKLNEAWVNLSNASMGITNIQYCLILLNALPSSYEVVATTILTSGAPSTLSHTKIIAWILNEEGQHSGNLAALNVACAPINSAGTTTRKHPSHLTFPYSNQQ